MFQNHIWNFFKLLCTALMYASKNGHTEIVKIFIEQEGININAKDIYLYLSLFISFIFYLKIIFENYLNYYVQHL